LLEKAKPVPSQQTVEEKEPLQLGVQLLKRWRDLAFEDQDLAPVSVVLTALAGRYYGGEESVSEALRPEDRRPRATLLHKTLCQRQTGVAPARCEDV
jgi:hypothetical protein